MVDNNNRCCPPVEKSLKGQKSCCSSDAVSSQSGSEHCLVCNNPGWHVPNTAVGNLVKKEHLSKLETGKYLICINPDCRVVYYNPTTGRIFEEGSLKVKVWLKDPGDDVPLCYCNKITRGQIKDVWLKGAKSYSEVIDLTGASKGNCNCKHENPAGKCCSGAIKDYLKGLEAADKNERDEKRSIEIDFMYLDLSVCTWCQSTEANLDEAIAEVAQVLKATGVDVNVKKIHIQSEEQAHELGFVSSPTIRINGQDIQLDVKEALCDSCGDLCGDSVDCRIWIYQGKEYTAPPKGMIIDAILREVYGGSKKNVDTPSTIGEVPDNLKKFFTAKQRKDANLSKEASGCCSTSTTVGNTSSC